jgi:outer membrane protein OmpA-like peptidoglycan-associated protein
MLALVSNGCKSWSKTAKGGTIGAAGGALAGAVIGKAAGNTVTGAIIGAAVGGAAGAAIGNYMDRQAEELREELKNAEVERVGQGIKITFDSGILFDFDSSELRSASKQDIQNLTDVLKDYDDTKILFAGHTDSKGSEEYNQDLSERRAKSVALFTAQQGVDAERMIIQGYGEDDPVADNSTETGRQQNRRVEIAIYANEELKERAEDGELGQEN